MDRLSVQLTELEYAQLVRRLTEEELAYLFKNALTQETAYESLLLKRKSEIHRHVAEAYERVYADRLAEFAAILAYHYAQAGDDAKTADYSLRAAESAVRLFAYTEARGHLTRALDSLQRLPDTQENRRRRVDAIFWYVEVMWGAFVPEQLIGLVLEAEALAKTLENPDGTTGDPQRLMQIHTRLSGVQIAHGEYPEAVRYARQGYAEASGLADQTLLATPAAQIGIALVSQGYFTDAVPFLVQSIKLMEQSPDRWEWFGALGALGASLAMRGRVEEGLAEVQRALEYVHASGNAFGITQSRMYLLVACLEQEDMTRMVEESEQTVEDSAKSQTSLFAALALGFKALASSRLGKPQDALETMAAAQALGAQLGSQLLLFDWLSAANAEIAYNAGNFEDALHLAEQAVALAQSCDGIFAEGWAQRVWAQAAAAEGSSQNEQVDEHFARSLELFERGGAVLEAARTRVAWGKVLQARGNAVAARQHFEQAASQFRASDLTGALAQTQQLINSLSA